MKNFSIKTTLIFIPIILLGLFWSVPSLQASEQYSITIQRTTVNDPLFSRQDNLIQMEIPEVWDITTGKEIIVAVIDTGVREEHEDLSNKFWVNSGEVPNNRRDDDGNGYVDDVHGYNFYENSDDLSDQNGHGTSIASVIGSSVNNSKGIAGINWRAKIMILKALNKLGGGEYHHVAQAIRYAVDNNAQVINMSFGTYTDNPELKQAVDYAISNNVTIIAATGNNGKNKILYPAAYANVIAVGAIDSMGQRASFSNYGDNLDIMSPGVDVPAAGNVTNTNYVSNSGTSYAAASITGLVSLILSKFPDKTPHQIETMLKGAATNKGNIAEYGSGIVNAVATFSDTSQTDKLSASILISRHNLPADGSSESTITITVQRNGSLATDRYIYINTDSNNLKINGELIQNAKFDLGRTDEFGKIRFKLSSYAEGQKRLDFFDSISDTQLGGIRVTFGSVAKVDYQAIVVNQSPDVELGLGEEAELWIELNNAGTSPWVGSGDSNIGQIRLGTAGPLDRSSDINHSSWLSNNRIATFNQSVVQPGETARISFFIKANKPGDYQEHFELVAEYKTWLPTLGINWNIKVSDGGVSNQPDGYQAKLESKSSDIELEVGQTALLTGTFRNTGTIVWSNGAQADYGAVRLGTYLPNDRASKFKTSTWLSSNRVSGTGANVAINGQLTLNFNIQAPNMPGVYYESFQLVSEHITWFGPSVKWKITVT